jgi:YD repeat-containing protein
MASRADAAGTTGYTYDTAGRLATLTDASTGTQLSFARGLCVRPSQSGSALLVKLTVRRRPGPARRGRGRRRSRA